MTLIRISGGITQPTHLLFSVVVVVAFLYTCNLQAKEMDISVIFHPDITQQTISQAEARQIFSARQQHWEDGSKIHVFVLNTDTALHQQFCQQVLQIFPYQLERIWNQITYSGQGDPPHIVKSPQALVQAVYTTPGAIGYASQKMLDDQQEKVIPQ